MKKTLVLVLLASLFLACNKKKEVQTNVNIETIDSVKHEEETLLIKDEQQITDYVLVNSIDQNCEAYFLSILESSKQFQKSIEGLDLSIKKNGGIGLAIRLEKKDNNINYIISETYSDKSTVIFTYVFILKTNKLYNEDYILGNSEEIDFDQKLLNKKQLICDFKTK